MMERACAAPFDCSAPMPVFLSVAYGEYCQGKRSLDEWLAIEARWTDYKKEEGGLTEGRFPEDLRFRDAALREEIVDGVEGAIVAEEATRAQVYNHARVGHAFEL